jgi:gliding motility-associated-like protein
LQKVQFKPTNLNLQKLILVLALVVFGFGGIQKAEASHMAGGEMTYACIGNDSFLVTLRVFRYCSGIPYNVSNISLTATSTCGGSATFQLTRLTGPLSTNAWDISQICSSQSSNCASGSTVGYEEYVYQGTVVLSPRCNCWTIGYTPPCCRNSTQNTSGGSVYFEATVCNVADTCNNSPTFGTSAIPYVCAGFPVSYNMGATDPDGDSLTYKFICARSGVTTCLTYTAPNSSTSPIPGITLDTLTGQIRFTPTVTGSFIVAVEITEWDANGNKLGTTMRDIQFRVETCSNTPPYDTLGIQNYTGVGYVDYNNNLIEVCLGDSFSFDVTIWDYVGYREDSLDTLIITSNVTSILPGATFSINAINDSVHVVTVGWRATQTGSLTNSFFIKTIDDACPVPGFTTSSYTVKVIPATEAGPPIIICRGVDTARTHVVGGTKVTWRILSGDSIQYGTNFWCDTTTYDTCMAATFFPNHTTVYEVNSNLGQGCKTKDTLTVTVVRNFTPVTHNDTTICFSDSTIEIWADGTLPVNYTYRWRPNQTMDFDTAQRPNVTPIFSTNYLVTITSDSGCIKKDTLYVGVTPPFPANISAFPDDSISCAGIPTTLRVDLGNNPQVCGLSTDPCPGSLDYYTSQTTTQTNGATGTGPSNWPAPYGNGFQAARMQFLYRASELSALGMSNGMVESIAFYVAANSGATTYRNFGIKMGCTSDTSLANWQSGLYQVYTPKNTPIGNGWVQHTFDSNFNYDGVSNVVIEICFDMTSSAATQSAQTAYTPTGFNSCLSSYSNTSSMCTNSSISWGSQVNRPNTRFSYCGAPDSAAFTYLWSPSGVLNHDTAMYPQATISQQTDFKVIVTDTFGLCFDSAFTSVDIAIATAGPDTTVCPGDSIQLFSSASGTCGSTTQYTWSNGQYLDDDSIQNPIAVVYQTTDFVVTISDTCGCNIQDTVTLTVNAMSAPNALQREPNCNSSDGELLIGVTGGYAPKVYSIDTGNTFQTDSSFKNLFQGYYSYVVIDSIGCVSPVTHDTLLMKGAPAIDSLTITDVSCFDFSDGEILAHVDVRGGITPTEYSVDSGQTWQLANPIVGLRATHYYVMARSATGCVSLPYVDTIKQPTRLELFKDSLIGDLCNQLGAGKIQVHATGGVLPYTFQWSNGVVDSINDNLKAGTYDLLLEDANGCIVRDTFDVPEPPALQIQTLTFDPVSCFGYSDGKILIRGEGGYDIGEFPLSERDSIPYYRFSIDGGQSWQSPVGFRSNDSATFKGLIAGTYSLLIEDQAGCRTFGTIDITEPPPMTISSAIDSVRLCVSNCTDLSAVAGGGNAGGYTYHWSPNLPSAQTVNVCPEEDMVVSVYASDSKACNSPAKFINVRLYDSLSIVTSSDTTICIGSLAQLYAQAEGGTGLGYTYEWYPFLDLSNPFVQDPTAGPGVNTWFEVTVNDECGSPPVTAKVKVDVLEDPGISFTADTLQGCEPIEIAFTNQTILPAFNCFWVFGNDTVYTCEDVTKRYESPGRHTVKLCVETELGCSGILEKENYITIHPTPTASFEMTPNPTTFINTRVTFLDKSDGNIVDWKWSFAELGESTKRNVNFKFPEDTSHYPVRLEVISDKGCYDDTLKNLVVASEYLLFIPSSFTPNGDGNNETWKPVGLGIEGDQYFVWVYDRWGKVVWYTEDYYEAWDGTDMGNGQLLDQGTYTWKVITGDLHDEKSSYEYYGNVTILK